MMPIYCSTGGNQRYVIAKLPISLAHTPTTHDSKFTSSLLDRASVRAHRYRIPAANADKWLQRRRPPQWLAFYQVKEGGDGSRRSPSSAASSSQPK
jgi:hypothetical protein